jgi:UDP:flavonoid glycosyltransferase YjiC (YdhE family)
MVTTSLVAAFAPHVLVVDTFPAGASDELVPVLRWPLERVFVFREQRPEHGRAAHFQHCLRAYHRTVVPHVPGEVALPLPEGMAATWTGPILIRERGEALPREEARARLGIPPGERPVLLVSSAGGGDSRLSAWAARAAAALAEAGFEVVLAVGPLARRVAESPRLRTTNYYPLAELLPAFDAALAPCGYNTAHELLHHGVPAAFIVADRDLDDQQERCRRLVQAGAALALEEPSEGAAVAAARRLLDPGCASVLRRAGRSLVPGGGALRAARAVLKLPE